MNDRKSSRYYLVAAIIWTVIAAIAAVLLFMAKGAVFPTLCGVALICFCVAGQWLRYSKFK